MGFTTRNGKLEKVMPAEKGERVIHYRVIASCAVTVDEKGAITAGQITKSTLAFHPDDPKPSADDMKLVLQASDQMIELGGVLICEQAQRKRDPRVKLAVEPSKVRVVGEEH